MIGHVRNRAAPGGDVDDTPPVRVEQPSTPGTATEVTRAALSRSLQRAYQATLDEQVPADLMDLLKQLR